MKGKVGIRELAERAKAEGAYDLAQGVIDAAPPEALMAALRSLPLEKISTYNNKRGVKEYRQAIVGYLGSRGWRVELEQVIATAGVTGGIVAALLTDLRPGAKVLLPEPFFIGHRLALEALGFDIQYLSVPVGQELDWLEVEKQMSEVDAAIVTAPTSPTGQVASVETLIRLSETAAESGCLLLIDEMYREFIWDKPPKDDGGYEQLNFAKTVLLRSWSKTFAIPGWRVGYAVTSPERVEEMAARHDALYIGGSTIAQHTLAVALRNNLKELNKYVADLRDRLQSNMKILGKAFADHGFTPLPVPATYYMMLKHGRENDMAAVEELIKKKIVTTPGNILFADSTKETGYIRIHFAVADGVVEEVQEILAG
ncbi:MAG: pyridoxal phosphate-dependent aminotransferase [bacterium]